MRGGSFDNSADNARSAYRNDNHADDRNHNLGFRPAKASRGPTLTVARAAPRRSA